jgi:hypothetical protein
MCVFQTATDTPFVCVLTFPGLGKSAVLVVHFGKYRAHGEHVSPCGWSL